MILMMKCSFGMILPMQIGTAYTGGVSVDMIQNAMPIATSTTLIILSLRSFWSSMGNTPGWSRDFTHILHLNM
jgi:hypothetical protein